MDGAASTRITISQGTDREKLNFGQDGDTELPFSISAWIFIKDVADTAGIIAAISDRQDGSPNVGKHQFLFQHGHPGSLSAILYDCDGDSVKIDHDDDPATPVQFRFGGLPSNQGLGARIRATTNQNILTNNTWHFVTMTYDGSKTKEGLFIYVDAVDRTTIRSKSNEVAPKFPYTRMRDTAVPLVLGNASHSFPSLPFENKMADVCIFNKALTLAEVQEIYNGGKVKNMVNASTYNNLISWWKMGDDKDQPGSDGIRDYVGVNHGTLENTAAIRESLDLGTDLEPNPATAGIHTHQRFGRTRGPKSPLKYTQNLVGNTNYVIPSSDSNELGASNWDIANEFKDKGLPTENQRHMHLLLDSSTSIGANKNVRIAVLGYISAFGIWSELLKYDGDQLPTIETSLQDGTAEYYVFDILGVDKVLFFATNNNADDISDWQLRAAFSTF